MPWRNRYRPPCSTLVRNVHCLVDSILRIGCDAMSWRHRQELFHLLSPTDKNGGAVSDEEAIEVVLQEAAKSLLGLLDIHIFFGRKQTNGTGRLADQRIPDDQHPSSPFDKQCRLSQGLLILQLDDPNTTG